jgi:hypothetical protein
MAATHPHIGPALPEALAAISLGSTERMRMSLAPVTETRPRFDVPFSFEQTADSSEAIAPKPSAGADIRSAEHEIFAAKVEAVWAVLQHQYASRITVAEVDHLFACFVFGLTSPFYAGREPARHFDACRSLVAMQLPKDRAEAALHSVPAPTQPWVESARDLIEGKAIAMGHALETEARQSKDFSATQANSAAIERLADTRAT